MEICFVSRVPLKKLHSFFKSICSTLLVVDALDCMYCNCHRLDLIISYLYSQKGHILVYFHKYFKSFLWLRNREPLQ